MQELSSLKKKIKNWIKKNPVVDVILFGSSVREKANPKDIDVCIILKDDEEKKSIEIVSSLKKEGGKELQVNIMTEADFITGKNTLVKTLLNEGISILNNSTLSKIYGFQNKTLFTYSLKGFKPTDRVKLHYVMRGRRGSAGMLEELQGRIIGDGVILLPTEKEDAMKEVLERWNVNYDTRRILYG